MKKIALFVIVLFLSIAGKSQTNTLVPLDNRVIVGKLSNGLTYYILPNKKPEKKIELRLVVNAGSVLETDAQQGLAHFCEHMAFNGTLNFKKNELVDYLQTAGVKFGAHINAYTSFDETVYMLSLPTEDADVVNKGFQILEDWAHNLSFDPEEIEKERGVVLEEYRLGLGAQKRMMTEYLPKVLYKSHYAKRLPIGQKDVLETFKPQTIIDFYNAWYRPDLMAVIVVGDIDIATAEAKIKKHFNGLTTSPNVPKRVETEVPDHEETFVTTVTDKEATYGTVQLAYKIEGSFQHSGNIKEYQKSLEQYLFYSMLNDRLQELSKKPETGFTSAYVYQDEMWVRSKEAVQAFAVVSAGKYDLALKNVAIELERVSRFGFTEGELKRAKINLKTALDKAIKEKTKTESSSYSHQLVSHYLTKTTMPSPEWEMEQYNVFEKQITTQNLRRLAEQFRQTNNRVVTMTGPESDKELMPAEIDILKILEDVKQINLTQELDVELPESFMPSKPLTGKIQSNTFNKVLNTYTLILSNGIKVIYKPTDLKNDEILFSAVSEGGTNMFEEEQYNQIRNGLGVISQTGVSTFSDSDVDKMLAGKSVRVSPYIGSTTEGMSGNCRPQDAETMMELIHLYFTSPRNDEAAFTGYVARQRSIYDNMEANPSSYFSLEFGKWLYLDHPRSFSAPKDADWHKTDYTRIFEAYKERFENPADFTFVFVGNIDKITFNTLLTNYLGSLPTTNKKEKTLDVGYNPRMGTERLDVKKGSEPKSTVQIVFHNVKPYDKREDLILDLTAEVLTIKLIEVLREQMGGVYGVSARSSFSRLPNSMLTFTIGFPCGPENVDTLISAALVELGKLANNGPEQKDLDKAKQTMVKTLKTSVQSNRFWLNSLVSQALYNEMPTTLAEMEAQIQSIKLNDIQDAVKINLNNEYKIGVLYPE